MLPEPPETGGPFVGGRIVCVNGADKDASAELGKLLHDFFCTDPDDMNYKELADRVRYFKEDEEGVAVMCKVLEDMRNEAAQKAKEQAAIDYIINIMNSLGFTVDAAMESLKIPASQRDAYAALVRGRLL